VPRISSERGKSHKADDDDLTDEDGFKVIEKYGNGISMFAANQTKTWQHPISYGHQQR